MSTATSYDIEHTSPIVVLALGSWEQHGPHLPLDTDTVIIDTVVATSLMLLNEHATQFLVAPTLTITASDEHHGFAGTLSTGTEALVQTVVSICRSASWAKGVCVVNGHGGNLDALAAIDLALTFEKIRHSVWSLPSYEGNDFHAGHTETSIMLKIAAHSVRLDRLITGNTEPVRELLPKMREGGVRAVSKTGVLGDATTATAEHGARVLDFYARHLSDHLAALIDEWMTNSHDA
jgi:mycofactocin system creatininase family protein